MLFKITGAEKGENYRGNVLHLIYTYYLEPVKLEAFWKQVPLMIQNHDESSKSEYIHITILVGKGFKVPCMSERIKKVPPFFSPKDPRKSMATLPETNIFVPKNGMVGSYDRFLLRRLGLFSGTIWGRIYPSWEVDPHAQWSTKDLGARCITPHAWCELVNFSTSSRHNQGAP